MTEEEYAIDYLKKYIETDMMYENRHYKQIELVLNLIQKQETEINKLNNVIDDLVGEIVFLNYETIGEWCNKDKGYKCQNCNTNNIDCIKEYFMKE